MWALGRLRAADAKGTILKHSTEPDVFVRPEGRTLPSCFWFEFQVRLSRPGSSHLVLVDLLFLVRFPQAVSLLHVDVAVRP